MFKKVCTVVAIALAAGTVGTIAAEASTPKPSGYCSKKEKGKTVKYTTPSKSKTYYLKCVPVTTYKWKKA